MTPDTQAHLGSRVRYFRESANLSQRELGDKIGHTANTISAMERGRTQVSDRDALDISKALGIGLADFLSEDESLPRPKSKRGFASLSPEKRREVAAKGGASVPDGKRSFSRSIALAKAAGAKGGANSHGGGRKRITADSQ